MAGPPSPRSPVPPPAMVVMTPVVRSTLRMRLLPTSAKYRASWTNTGGVYHWVAGEDGLNHRSKWRPHTGSVTFQQAESLPYLPVDEEVIHWFAEDFLRCSRVN